MPVTLDALSTHLAQAWRETGRVEIVAAALAVAYLLLAIRQSILCWVAAFVSSCLYVYVMFHARLYMESALNAFYAAMAIYGFRQWQPTGEHAALAVHRWPASRHFAALAAIVVLAALSAVFLRRYTGSPSPFLDSLVTWSSVFATYLVARKVYENWHWWFVIDAVCLGLYVWRHLYLTVLLFAIYLTLICVGVREWRRSLVGAANAT
ncbi:MAG TPA: nicotinamide riboside transporter PnuC [Steroidobacteraceae bacterium]|nr:nicotinamide riboside transporter PnuC [Steroidobacteraceae bacterium]